MRRKTKSCVFLVFGLVFMVVYCEFLIYYVVISQCSWPAIKTRPNTEVLRALMITDIHMLGYQLRDAVDKWRREWQMHRAFQTIISLHNPDVVFILGDIFNEGEFATNEQFDSYVKDFHSKFYVPPHIKMFILVGNHDAGFHYAMKPGHMERFHKKFNTTSVRFLTLKNNHFVLVNSVAMEGDNCNLCRNARDGIEKIAAQLDCARNSSLCKNDTEIDSTFQYSRPILLQHYPMIRESDAICTEPDSVPTHEKDIPFRLKIDCYSQDATDFLATKLRPRAVFEGHTHYGCKVDHKYDDIEFTEHTIPSFSWRNIYTPKYMLVSITPESYAFNKCGLPMEFTLAITAIIILSITIYIVRKRI